MSADAARIIILDIFKGSYHHEGIVLLISYVFFFFIVNSYIYFFQILLFLTMTLKSGGANTHTAILREVLIHHRVPLLWVKKRVLTICMQRMIDSLR